MNLTLKIQKTGDPHIEQTVVPFRGASTLPVVPATPKLFKSEDPDKHLVFGDVKHDDWSAWAVVLRPKQNQFSTPIPCNQLHEPIFQLSDASISN